MVTSDHNMAGLENSVQLYQRYKQHQILIPYEI